MAEYIERKRAIVDACNSLELYSSEYAKLEDALNKIPAADVSPVRHGKWIEYTKVIIPEPYNKWEQAWKCSECGFDDGFVAYNYCPNCGAKMDLEG